MDNVRVTSEHPPPPTQSLTCGNSPSCSDPDSFDGDGVVKWLRKLCLLYSFKRRELTFDPAVKRRELKDCTRVNNLNKTIEASVCDQREAVKRRG